MKVAVITLHHVRNYGSLLQTYATQTILKKMGCETEVVDYIPRGLTLKYGILTIKSKGNFLKDFCRKAIATVTFTVQQITMIRFLKKHISLSKRKYDSFDALQNNPPVADVYVAGSDQIWNTQNYNLPNDIKGYYLQFAPVNKKRISYASSIGKDCFGKEERAEVHSYLSKFDAISVRESVAVQMLEDINISGAVHVLDPTLLLSRDEWIKFAGYKDTNKKPFIFVYNLNRNPHVKEFARTLAKEKGLEIINFADTLDFFNGAKNRFHNTVFDFLYYLIEAEYVVTDSFHGTAFSINLGKKFVSFSAPRFNSRLLSVLQLFGLEKRFMTEFSGDCSIVDEPLDYEMIGKRLEEERIKSIEYLKKSIFGVEEKENE